MKGPQPTLFGAPDMPSVEEWADGDLLKWALGICDGIEQVGAVS